MLNAKKVAVLGGGSFGTVMANIIAGNGHDVRLWLRDQNSAKEINEQHVNSKYLPDYVLSESLRAETDLATAVEGCSIVFVSVPSSSCRQVAKELDRFLVDDAMVISTTKGIESPGFLLMSQVLAAELPGHAIGVMSGPNLAKEIAERQLSATVIASESKAVQETVQALLHCNYFRVYANDDCYGVELGGALKNIYAIMSGLGGALGLGQNTIGMLLTRALSEMSRFALPMGADPMTFIGLAGVGDLIVTCMSPLSRNYRVGYEIGQGKTLEDIVTELGQVAEGVNTLRIVKAKADELGIYMPLLSGMYEILFEHKPVMDVVGGLMLGEQNQDVEYSFRSKPSLS